MYKIECYKYRSWDEFKANVISELFQNGHFRRGRFLFRGHQNSEWALTPYFDRIFTDLENKERVRVADQLINYFIKECEGKADIDHTVLSKDTVLAFAQHHGVPTRLLDWTESPYIAAFFAYSGAINSQNFNGNVAVWVLDTQSDIWTEELGVSIINPVSIGNTRLRNQLGKFTLLRTPFRALEDFVSYQNPTDKPLRQILIPAVEARKAISDLDVMGINHAQLFPGADGCARASLMRTMLELTVDE